MVGPLINAGTIITLFAIAAPFVFVLLIVRMTIGSDRRRRKERSRRSDEEIEKMNEISKGLRDLRRRLDNLEAINESKKNKER